MPVLELAVYPGSDAFLANPLETLTPGFKFAEKHAQGLQKVFFGVQVENPKLGYFALIWDTYEDHKALMDRPDYPELIALLTPAFAGKLDLQHITFGNDPSAALSAPTTELATMKLKSGVSKEKIEAAVDQLVADVNAVKTVHPPATFGPSREHEDTFVLAIGWDSKEAHVNHVKSSEDNQKLIAEVKANGDVTEVVHVNFQAFNQ